MSEVAKTINERRDKWITSMIYVCRVAEQLVSAKIGRKSIFKQLKQAVEEYKKAREDYLGKMP